MVPHLKNSRTSSEIHSDRQYLSRLKEASHNVMKIPGSLLLRFIQVQVQAMWQILAFFAFVPC